MFANTFQSGLVSIFYSCGSNPLTIWDKQVKNGHIRRVVDEDVKSLVLEIGGTNVSTTYITCPVKKQMSLGIKLPFLVMIIKNLKKYFTFEIQILDDKNMHRRFRVSNFQSTTKVHPFCTCMPIGLNSGWNQVQFNLADFTKRAYGSVYLETTRIQIHANIRIRRIYFSDVLYSDADLPNEYKLFLPGEVKPAKLPIKEKTTKEKKDEKVEVKAEVLEKEPSGALPSPVEVETPRPEADVVSTEAEAGEQDIERFADENEVTEGGALATIVEVAEEGDEMAMEGAPLEMEGDAAPSVIEDETPAPPTEEEGQVVEAAPPEDAATPVEPTE